MMLTEGKDGETVRVGWPMNSRMNANISASDFPALRASFLGRNSWRTSWSANFHRHTAATATDGFSLLLNVQNSQLYPQPVILNNAS